MVLLVALLFASAASAQSSGAQSSGDVGEPMTVQMAAEPLDAALARFSRISGVQMLYDSNLTAGRRSAAVVGRYPPRELLMRLLEGTGLRARFMAGGSVVIAPAMPADMTLETLRVQAPPLLGASRPDERSLAYVRRVQRDVTEALQAEAAALKGGYRISLRLWVAPDGRIVRTEPIEASRSPALDAAFRARIEGVQVGERPPETLPQPLRIEFIVR